MTSRFLVLAGVLATMLVAAAPASAVVNASPGPGGSASITSDGIGDTITVECVAGTVKVAGFSLGPCSSLASVLLEAGGGNDAIDLGQMTPALFPKLAQVNIRGEEGTDTIVGSQTGDTIESDALDSVEGAGGDDTIEKGKQVNGGPGDDLLLETTGTADGGAGDDVFGEPGAVTSLAGGAGYDNVNLNFGLLTAQSLPLVFTLEDSRLNFQATGLPLNTTIALNSVEHVQMQLLNGGQTVDAGGFSGSLDIDGRGGPDRLIGGSGPNALRGGAGDDVLIGGPSSDLLDGAAGNDQLQSRDGKGDVDNCGDGADVATADLVDALVGCETALLPPVPPVADTTAPDTTGLKGPGSVAKGKTATFQFASTEAGSSFRCKVDSGKAVACSSPYKVKTGKLKAGKHTFSVFAVDAAGNADPTPATKKFSVTAAAKKGKGKK